MEAKEPTEEQIREFWEWCGFVHGSWQGWFEPKENGGRYIGDDLPPVDLNNLFKYAVPIAIKKLQATPNYGVYFSRETAIRELFSRWIRNPYKVLENRALVLFWTIREVIHGS